MALMQEKLLNYLEPRLSCQKGKSYSAFKWRLKVIERDNKTCQNCLNTVQDPYRHRKPGLEAHHMVPKIEGGKNTINNGVTLCSFCHYYIGQAYLNTGLDFRGLEACKGRVQRIRESRKLLRSIFFNHLRNLL